jgi:hypothetical protein
MSHNPPNLCLLSSWDYSHKPPYLARMGKIIIMTSNKGIISRIYKEIKKLILKEQII